MRELDMVYQGMTIHGPFKRIKQLLYITVNLSAVVKNPTFTPGLVEFIYLRNPKVHILK